MIEAIVKMTMSEMICEMKEGKESKNPSKLTRIRYVWLRNETLRQGQWRNVVQGFNLCEFSAIF